MSRGVGGLGGLAHLLIFGINCLTIKPVTPKPTLHVGGFVVALTIGATLRMGAWLIARRARDWRSRLGIASTEATAHTVVVSGMGT